MSLDSVLLASWAGEAGRGSPDHGVMPTWRLSSSVRNYILNAVVLLKSLPLLIDALKGEITGLDNGSVVG